MTDSKQAKTARNLCFTLNNYTDVEYNQIVKLNHKYLVIGKEVGESGTPHLQGYIEFQSSKALNVLYKLNPRIHWETRKGTAKQASDYCMKEGKFEEFGEITSQGQRNDLEEAMELIRNGASELDLYHATPSVAFRYGRGMEKYRLLVEKEKAKGYRKKNVSVYWGETGTGKTRTAMEENPDAFIVSDGITGFWWDGYDGESVVVMDEFRGNIPLSQLLRILDGYACMVSIRGGSRQLTAQKIIITSNTDPNSWYQNADDRSREALFRRLDFIKYFKKTTESTSDGVILGPSQENLTDDESEI